MSIGTDRIVQIGHIWQGKELEFWASGFGVVHSPTLLGFKGILHLFGSDPMIAAAEAQ